MLNEGYCFLMQFIPIGSLFMVRSWLGDETSSKYDVFGTCELGLGDGMMDISDKPFSLAIEPPAPKESK